MLTWDRAQVIAVAACLHYAFRLVETGQRVLAAAARVLEAIEVEAEHASGNAT